MEYVRGESLYEYCSRRRLDVDARLKMFGKICEAVEYAHRNLVVHRDLKPGNILIDEDGNPKLLDFGIAKIIESDGQDSGELRTEFHARVMTPQYASPEQVRGEPVTVATDTYALGVLLFHLLTGESPYHPSSPNPRDIENSVLEETPKRPSVAVSELTGTDAAAQASAERRSTPVKLSRKLTGDLDNIALTCLQKDPARRYGSVQALNQDIGRYLRNEPVLAHADSLLYRARKFVQRNRLPVGIATAAGTIVIAMTLFYTHRLAQERDQAELAAAEASAVSEFMGNLFFSASPMVAQGKEVKALDLLHIAKEDIDELKEQPRLQSRLLEAMGTSYAYLGAMKEGEAMIAQSVALSENDPATDQQVLGDAFGSLAEVQSILESFEAAEANAKKGIAILEKIHGESDPAIVRSLGILSRVYSRNGRNTKARPVLERALHILQSNNQPTDNNELLITGSLMDVLGELDENDEALQIGRTLQEQSDNLVGPLHPDSIIRRGNLSVQAMMSGSYPEALALAELAYTQAETIWEPGKPAYAYRKLSYARALMLMGHFDDSEAQFGESLQLAPDSDWADSRLLFKIRIAYGALLLNSGKSEQALAYLEPLLLEGEQVYGASSTTVIGLRQLLSEAKLAQGDSYGALILAREILPDLAQARFPVQRANYVSLIRALTANGEATSAQEYVTRLIESYNRSGLADTPVAMLGWAAIGAHYQAIGEAEQASAIAERIAKIAKAGLPEGHWLIDQAQKVLNESAAPHAG